MIIKKSSVLNTIPVIPVCNCGRVIKDLVYVRYDEKFDSDMKPRGYFIPRNCPKCGKKIEGVAIKVAELSEDVERVELFGEII